MPLVNIFRAGLVGCFLTLPVGAMADGLAGSYLSGIYANSQNDYKASVKYFTSALKEDPKNIFLMQNALLALVASGDVEQAVGYARRITDAERPSQLADLVLLSHAIKTSDYNAAARLLSNDTQKFTALLTGLMSGWVELGRGKMASASEVFDNMKGPEAVKLFGQYHKALALAVVGDFEGADKILQGDERGSLRLNRGSLISHAQVLAQLDKSDEAVKMITQSLRGTADMELIKLRDDIAAGKEIEYDFITDAQQGAAEVFYTLASALNEEDSEHSSLLYARLAEYLRKDYTPAVLLAAEVLREQEQYDLATESFTKIAPDDPMFLDAELGRADTLLDAEKPEAAIEVLRGLTRSHADTPRVFMSLGDVLRGQESYADARDAYVKAAEMLETPQRNHWFLYYARAITSERLGDWDRAEADFRKSLELFPGQPLVLNYLGYSLVEKGIKLEEAQKMIEDAVAARPDSGFITDSLGWVLYTLGKFDEAVAPMERAVELIPDDPIINDHLGDVYWKVNRKREAQFQWKRALSFDPEEKDADRIRRKLELGLDKVLAAEAALPKASGDDKD